MQLLVDASIVFHRCHYSMDHLATQDGTPTGMEFGTFKVLQKYNSQYESMILCFDPPSTKTEREKRVSGYKANRSVKPPEFYERMEHLKKALKSMYSWSEHPGIEADRLLFTLGDFMTRPKPVMPRFILTNDYDMMQTLQPGVCVIRTGHGKDRHWDSEDLWDKFKVRPSYWALFRALTGDPSDNLPGCKGIGKVWGSQFIREAVRLSVGLGEGRDIEALIKVVDAANLTVRQRENWNTFKQRQLLINHNLIRLTPYKGIKIHGPTGASIQEYLDKLEITTMTDETEF